jgi:hypothetical protein
VEVIEQLQPPRTQKEI